MIFEREEDLLREKKAIETFVKTFGGSYQKLDPFDIDYKIFDENKKVIGYAEVKGRIRTMRDAYPLPISAHKVIKLIDKRLNPLIIWACEDGIIYGRPERLTGQIKQGGRPPREGAVSDIELMVYYDKQKDLKYVRYS
jgi:hypothetical protein